ncbi:UNVERIFIED_ORG: replicative DNA helicase [Burkholderia sp. 1595]|uniref:Replicative DNA helicase n=1 Tax=Paraburkholderia terricola TaxID=169427 RepID=A0ABU1LSP8_9BURK|nr:replicative DNA helicase [Paraburkholderia terricola]MDR6409738.1 replicative DNA helicase [Paraburkholderia terricola]
MNAPDHDDRTREVPHSIEMEQSVLGALLLDNAAIDRVGDLHAGHFYRAEHRTLFETILKLIAGNRTADMLTVFERLQASGKAGQVGGLAYLNALAQNTPGSANITRYAGIVIDRWTLRGLLAAADEVRALVFERRGRDVSEIVSEAQAKFEPLAESRAGGPKFIGEYLPPVVEEIDEQSRGVLPSVIATGFRDLDRKLDGGMNAGELIVMAGRPSMGKTALAIGIGANVARKVGTVLVFSLEMPGRQLTQRSLAREGRIAMPHIKNGALMTKTDFENLTKATEGLAALPMLIDESAALSVAEITSRSRAVKRQHGLSLVIVDYIGLMTGGDGENRTQQVGSFSRGLKGLAKRLGVPVIALSQLNRGVENRTDKRPIMADLRESGDIEQDADLILMLYRDEVYYPDSPDRGTAEIIVAKQRNGEVGMTRLAYIGAHTMFADLAPGYLPVPRNKPQQSSRGFDE